MRHYRRVMGRISTGWPDGSVGASAARSVLGRGAVAIVVASPDSVVRQIFLMEGRSVFAKFREVPVAPGATLAAIAAEPSIDDGPRARRSAITGAIRQIEARHARAANAMPA